MDGLDHEATSSKEYQDAALLVLMWYAFGRASDLGYIQKCNLSVCANNVLFLRFIRTKTSEEQGISLFPDNECFITCPHHAIGMALVMQSYPGEPLLDLPQLATDTEQVPTSITDGIPLVEALVSCGEDQPTPDTPTQERRQGPAALKIHAYVNRIVKSMSKIQAQANPTSNLSSHSFRRGGAQHANNDSTLAAQWIFDRGSWNMTATNKAFAYVFNTTSEDQKVSKVLSGWNSTDSPRIPSLDIFDSSTREQINQLAGSLFAASLCLDDRAFKLDYKVVEVLMASLLQHFPQVNDKYPMSPYCVHMRRCMFALGISRSEAMSWGSRLMEWSTKENSDRSIKVEAKATQESKLINHLNCVISELTVQLREMGNQNKEMAERLVLLENRLGQLMQQPELLERVMTSTQSVAAPAPVSASSESPQEPERKQGRSNPKSAAAIWFEWYTKTPRLWDHCPNRQYKSTAKQIVGFMKLFLPDGFVLDPSASSYPQDVYALGTTAEANMLQFMMARSSKKKHGSALLKALRMMRNDGAFNDLITAYRARVAVGQVIDPAPENTKADILLGP